ncbi:uncharacterized protein [Prorops nasuta]|uniref:uncharacterized protein n=1 Tax=Prorops nasuta TaxID=863751 RepID=UPI0034CD1422
MFSLKESVGNPRINSSGVVGDEFGWWLSDGEKERFPGHNISGYLRSGFSPSSSASINFQHKDSEENQSYDLNENSSNTEQESSDAEKIDLSILSCEANNDKENNVKTEKNVYSSCEGKFGKSENISVGKERLARFYEYSSSSSISATSYMSFSSGLGDNESSRKARRCRRRLNYLIDSKQVGASQLKALLNPDVPECRRLAAETRRRRSISGSRTSSANKHTEEIAFKSFSPELPRSVSSYELSYEKSMTGHSSLEDSSGIQSNDWSLEDHSDTHINSISRYEDSPSSRNHRNLYKNAGIDPVEFILRGLERDPRIATVLLEDDRFVGKISPHNQLTRLALAIETDGYTPATSNHTELLMVQQLREKIQQLQNTSKDIHKDICALRKDFQSEEEKLANLRLDASRLHEDIHEVRYLDDLLNMLRGELDKISRRNWPFAIGRADYHSEEFNLVI